MLEYVKIFIDNVEIQWDSGTNISFLNYTRNLILDSADHGDYVNKWLEQGGMQENPNGQWVNGFTAWRQNRIQLPLAGSDGARRRLVPLWSCHCR